VRRYTHFLLTSLLLLGCQEELLHDLEEQSANEVVVALQNAGLHATKVDGKRGYTVTVPAGSTTAAVQTLRVHGLPRPPLPGFELLLENEPLVPTAADERLRTQVALSQELRRALRAIDGVIDAHVTLATPTQGLGRAPAGEHRASVVLRHAGTDAPVSADEIQRVVAGAVAELETKNVEVLLTPSRPVESALVTANITRIGPLGIATDSLPLGKRLSAGVAVLVVGLGSSLVFALRRRQK
jgi:type III secretion protein J